MWLLVFHFFSVVLSSHRFSTENLHHVLYLHDGVNILLDRGFADDIHVFATSRDDTIRLLEGLWLHF